MENQPNSYPLCPIGQVRRENGQITLQIEAPYRPGLLQLDQYSHVTVLWWSTRFDAAEPRTWLQIEPPYAPGHLTGVFACRAPYRPNPISLTTCKLLGVDLEAGQVRVADIDAFDGTPLLDLKPYIPVCDRVQQATIPEWLEDWPEWLPEQGLGLMPDEA
jgi:tRNA (adenine37-N6)-methyltransferase